MLGHVVILFNILRSHQTVLHSSCTILRFHLHPSSSNSPVFANTCYSPLIIIIIARGGYRVFLHIFNYLKHCKPIMYK